MDPADGIVLGVRWGADERACAAVLGPLSGEGVHRVAPTVALAEARWIPELAFELDALCAISLRSATGPSVYDGDALAGVIDAVTGWAGEPPRRTDEGWLQVDAGVTRITVDLVDGRLVFEDVDS